jgi:hypothetical protein
VLTPRRLFVAEMPAVGPQTTPKSQLNRWCTAARLVKVRPDRQARIVQLLVARVDMQEDALEVRVRAEGMLVH